MNEDASGSEDGLIIDFEQCKELCPEDCSNNNRWKYWDNQASKYVREEKMTLVRVMRRTDQEVACQLLYNYSRIVRRRSSKRGTVRFFRCTSPNMPLFTHTT